MRRGQGLNPREHLTAQTLSKPETVGQRGHDLIPAAGQPFADEQRDGLEGFEDYVLLAATLFVLIVVVVA